MDHPDTSSHTNKIVASSNRSAANSHILPPRDGSDFELVHGLDTGCSKGRVAVTSRVSVQKYCSVVGQFGLFKRAVANQTGFGGIMGMHTMQKINLKYNAWAMGRVDPGRRILKVDQDCALPICGKDMNILFGLPYTGKQVSSVCGDLSDACLEYTTVASELSDRGTHSLKAAETILLKEINESSTQIEIDCFKIAYVIFTVGHLLCPSTKHDYTIVDYWGALNNPSTLADFNWAEFVLDRLMDVVRKFKADMVTRHIAIHLVGCHIFLQGIRGGDVGYNKPIYSQPATIVHPAGTPSPTEPLITPVSATCRPPPSSINNIFPRSENRGSANDFYRYLSRAFLDLSADPVCILLKEHNARHLSRLTDLRQQWQDEMFSYSERLLSIISERYRNCKCSASKHFSTPTPQHLDQQGESGRAHNVCNITPINLMMNNTDCSGSATGGAPVPNSRRTCTASINSADSRTSGDSCAASRKRIRVEQPIFPPATVDNIENLSVSDTADPDMIIISAFASDVVTQLALQYCEKKPPEGVVIFGQTANKQFVSHELSATRFAREPWSTGSLPHQVACIAVVAIAEYMQSLPITTLARQWIVHNQPRLVSLDGMYLREQLIGSSAMSHELCVVIMRRLGQIDDSCSREATKMKWRKFMDPDFATYVLADVDPRTVQSVQTQFMHDAAAFNMAACRLFYAPALFHDGWVWYAFDMLKKKIIILDPKAGPKGHDSERVKIHNISFKILDALFKCITTYFKSWACSNDKWSVAYPIIMDELFSSDESGLVITFFAKHFDGDKLVGPINKVCLYDALRMDANMTNLAADALKAVKISFHVL